MPKNINNNNKKILWLEPSALQLSVLVHKSKGAVSELLYSTDHLEAGITFLQFQVCAAEGSQPYQWNPQKKKKSIMTYALFSVSVKVNPCF